MKNGAHRSARGGGAAGGESGMALVLALMALMVLTVVGLTLAATTSTEVQVAANYRWSQQALYNAEAGLSVAKVVVSGALDDASDFTGILPARTAMWAMSKTPPSAKTTIPGYTPVGSRSFENWQCDARGNGMGNGVIIPTDTGNLQNQPGWGTETLNGFFTAWMRRPVVVVRTDADPTNVGKLRDYTDGSVPGNFPDGDALVILAEGVAPANAAAGNRAVQYMEVTAYPYVAADAVPPCSSLGTQTGQGPGNHNVACIGQGWSDVTIGGAPPPGLGGGVALP